MNYENSVILSGLLHHLSRKQNNGHFQFSLRHENLWTDGTTRKDFLNTRAFNTDIQEKLKSMDENTPLKIKGVLRSSKGSGELFVDVLEVENEPENFELENFVRLSGFVHVIKAQQQGQTGTGKYTRFAVRQELPEHGRDFIVVRVYDEGLQKILATKEDDSPVTIEGTMRSSKGSGVNYVRCSKID